MKGYRYKSSGYLLDVIVVTEKGIREGRLPKGVVVPIGHYHVPDWKRQLDALEREHGLYRCTAKHCDDKDVMTHIVPCHAGIMVNRFGILLSKTKMPDTGWCIDVEDGRWFQRKTVSSYDELLKYL